MPDPPPRVPLSEWPIIDWCDPKVHHVVRTTYMTDPTWTTWTSNQTVTLSSYDVDPADYTWCGWNTTNSTIISNRTWYAINHPGTPEQAEERARRSREMAEARREAEQATRRRAEEVKERSLTLLRSILTPEQLEEFERRHRFTVVGSSGRRYRIKCAGQQGNVEWLNSVGNVGGAVCAHPSYVPDGDAWIAQKLALETDDEGFLRVANLHSGAWPPDSVRAA